MSDVSDTVSDLLKGDRRAIAKAITLIESHKASDKEVLQEILVAIPEREKKFLIVGVTGSPGVGKSTFLDTIINEMPSSMQIAVLTIDPSSAISGGSVLGDKTRMSSIINKENVFIRPSPAGNSLGGVASTTYETALFFAKLGYDYIFIETVGVGQSEYYVKQICDILLLLLQPGSGDELQAMKKGIMETADMYIVTKSDGPSEEMATKMKSEIEQNAKGKMVVGLSSLAGSGFEPVMDFLQEAYKKGDFGRSRKNHQNFWLRQSLPKTLEEFWLEDQENKSFLEGLSIRISQGKCNYEEAKSLLSNRIKNKYN